MSKKNEEIDFGDVIEKLYYFLKLKLNFDDIQAGTTIASLILLPVSGYLGFLNNDMIFITMFFITIAIDVFVIVYSVIKLKYFKNAKVNFIKEFEEKLKANKKIIVSTIQDVNVLNPYEFETFAREYFKRNGYRAWNTQKSYDKGADVVAEKGKLRTVIQVKHSRKSLSPYAVYQVMRAKHAYHAEVGVLFTNSQLTSGAILDAQRDDIKEINGHMISKYLRNNDPIEIRKTSKF